MSTEAVAAVTLDLGGRLGLTPLSVHAKRQRKPATRVILRNNRLSEIGDDVGMLATDQLRELDLSCNTVCSAQSAALARLSTGLHTLRLSHNWITSQTLQQILTSLRSLRVLDLSHNHVCGELLEPSTQGADQCALESLNLSHNRVSGNPFSRLPRSLKVLNLSFNSLTSIPNDLHKLLPGLEELDVSDNSVSGGFPLLTLNSLASLRRLNLMNNSSSSSSSWWFTDCKLNADDGRGSMRRFREEVDRLANETKARGCRSYLLDLRNCCESEIISFKVVARDAAGRDRVSGGDDVRATVSGPDALGVSVADLGDGTYDVSATAGAPGLYTVTISVNDSRVPGTPVTVRVACHASKGEEDQDADFKEEEEQEQGGGVGTGKSFGELVSLCREYNIRDLVAPEFLFVSTGPSVFPACRIVERVFGVKLRLSKQNCALNRPIVFSVLNKAAPASGVTVRRDRLLLANVSGGMRDLQLPLETAEDLAKFNELLGQRNKDAASSVPIELSVESAKLPAVTLVVAPSNNPKVVADLVQQSVGTPRHVVLAMECMSWDLVETSQYVRLLLSSSALSGPAKCSRVTFVFTGLDTFLATNYSGAATSNANVTLDFLPTNPTATGHNNSLLGRSVFLSLSNTTSSDLSALERAGYDHSRDSQIGISSLRKRLLREVLVDQFHKRSIPVVHAQVARKLDNCVKSLDEAGSQLKELQGDGASSVLRKNISCHVWRFFEQIKELVEGTVAPGPPSQLGSPACPAMVAERIAATSGSSATPRRPKDVDECRLYGGAQFVRELVSFSKAADGLATDLGVTIKSLKTILGAPNGCVPPEEAAKLALQLAQRGAVNNMVPLVEKLSAALSDVMTTLAAVAEVSHLRKNREEVACDEEAGEKELVAFSYFVKNVKDLFVEMSADRIARWTEGCVQEITSGSYVAALPFLTLKKHSDSSESLESQTAVGAKETVKMAEDLYKKLVSRASDLVQSRFYDGLLRELVSGVPLDIHATLMSLSLKHMQNLFKVEALVNRLKAQQSSLASDVEAHKKNLDKLRALSL